MFWWTLSVISNLLQFWDLSCFDRSDTYYRNGYNYYDGITKHVCPNQNVDGIIKRALSMWHENGDVLQQNGYLNDYYDGAI